MKALALVLCFAVPAFADEPRCLEPSDRIALAQILVSKDAEILALQKSVKDAPSPVLVVTLVALGVIAGGAAGAAIATAVRR